MKCFIDFDGTLIDAARIREDVLAASEFSSEVNIHAHYDTFRKNHPFTISGLIQHLKEQGLDGTHLRNLFNEHAHRSDEYVFDDAVHFLKALKDEGHELTLLTFDPKIDDWQKPKVDASGLGPFLDTVTITSDKKINEISALHLTEPFIFIDDKQTEIDAMQSAFPNSLCIKHVTGSPLLAHLETIKNFINKQNQ